MKNSSAWPTDDIESVIEQYGDMLYRLCLIILRSESDAEDAVQDTFIRLFRRAPEFESSEHRKAWLIRVATNRCRDMLRFRARHPLSDAEIPECAICVPEDSGILEALTSLPEKYRIVLTLYYVEDCRIEDIAGIINRTPSAVKMRLKKGRALLEEIYRKEYMQHE